MAKKLKLVGKNAEQQSQLNSWNCEVANALPSSDQSSFFPDLPQIDLIMIFPRRTKLGREDIIHVAIQVTNLIVGSEKRDPFAYEIFFVVSVKRSSF